MNWSGSPPRGNRVRNPAPKEEGQSCPSLDVRFSSFDTDFDTDLDLDWMVSPSVRGIWMYTLNYSHSGPRPLLYFPSTYLEEATKF